MAVICGIDRIDEYADVFRGKRLGLATGASGIGRDYRSSVDILKDKCDLRALFAPEHGVRGEMQGGAHIENHIDKWSGLPVYGMFDDQVTVNSNSTSALDALYMPPREGLDKVDAIVFDIQDAGSRYFTYASTLFFVMKACAAAGKECIVLDRPNPIGGAIEGNTNRDENLSFVGLTHVPIRHGMTLGELARMFNGEYHLGCRLSVVPVAGWTRDMYFDETGLPFVNPSPNMPGINALALYCGICLFEAANVSDGRGTTSPFEQVGAPFIDPMQLKAELDALNLPGVRFSTAYFVPLYYKQVNQLCAGVRIHITDRRALRPVELGVRMVRLMQRLYPDDFKFNAPQPGKRWGIDLLSGTDELRMNQKSADEIVKEWSEEARAFGDVRERYGLYK